MRKTRTTLSLLILISFFGCKEEIIEIEDQIITETDELKQINAWEPPFNLTDNNTPTDVVTKLQQAINTAHLDNKRLIVEKGSYVINSQITFPENIDIDFGGAEFKRESGIGSGDIFDMFTNDDHVNGNTNIIISNLIINGNKNIDNLDEVIPAHRFSGLRLVKVTDSKLHKVTVTQTVNGEIQDSTNTSAAGVYFESGCSNVNCYEINAYGNSRTGILIRQSSSVRIFGSITHDNTGSGISSSESPRCEYYDVISYHNGFIPGHIWGVDTILYSNVSVNGDYSKVDGVLTYDCTGSGLNIGHSGTGNNSSNFTIVDNVESYGNGLEGITITNSDHVILSNLNIYDNLRNNIIIHDGSSEVQIQNAIVSGYNSVDGVGLGGSGIRIDGGSNHNLNNINAYNNFGAGIYITGTDGPVSLGSEVNCYNNGQMNFWGWNNPYTASIHVQSGDYVYINGSKAYSNQPSGSITQKYGIILQDVNHVRVIYAQSFGNGTQNGVLQLGANSDVVIIN